MIFLLGVEQAIGRRNFNAMHPMSGPGGSALYGIGVPLLWNGNLQAITSRVSPVQQHLALVRYRILDPQRPHVRPLDIDGDPMTGPISKADMVPGDYIYINNLSDHDVIHRGGAWNGENAVYFGSDAFYGLGLGTCYQTEAALKLDIVREYNSDPPSSLIINWQPAAQEEILWTVLASPSATGNPDEAGPFMR